MRCLVAFACLLGGACNSVFGIDETRPVDAAPLPADAPPDAPIVCPPIGTVPTFSQAPRVILGDSCKNYTISRDANLAIAECNGLIVEGAIDSPMLTPASITAEAGQTLSDPRLSPDGSQLFVTSRSATDRSIRIYRRSGAQWVFDSTPTIPSVPFNDTLFASTPSRGPAERLVIHHFVQANMSHFDEWAHDGGDAWHLVQSRMPASFGVSTMAQPALSEDARRLVFIGNASGSGAVPRYADRIAGGAFGTAQLIDTPFANVQYPYLTGNCDRLYVTGINTLNYVEQ